MEKHPLIGPQDAVQALVDTYNPERLLRQLAAQLYNAIHEVAKRGACLTSR
jgi:hypothetical protein